MVLINSQAQKILFHQQESHSCKRKCRCQLEQTRLKTFCILVYLCWSSKHWASLRVRTHTVLVSSSEDESGESYQHPFSCLYHRPRVDRMMQKPGKYHRSWITLWHLLCTQVSEKYVYQWNKRPMVGWSFFFPLFEAPHDTAEVGICCPPVHACKCPLCQRTAFWDHRNSQEALKKRKKKVLNSLCVLFRI